jgi:hypothetical protein
MTSRVEQRLLRGSVAAAAGTLLTIAQSVIQVPILLAFWSPELLSAWLLVNAAVVLITAGDVGLQSYVGAEFCKRADAGPAAIGPVLGSAVLGACLIAAAELAVAVSVVAIGRFDWLAADVGDPLLRRPATIAFLILTGYMCGLGSIGGVAVRLYPTVGLYARSQWCGNLQRACMFLAVIAAAAAGAGLVGAACASAVVGGTIAIGILLDLRRCTPGLWPWWRGARLATALRQIAASSVLTVIAFLDHAVTLVLMGVVAGCDDVSGIATFVTLRTASNMVQQASMVAVSPLIPEMSRYAASGGMERTIAAVTATWFTALGPAALLLCMIAPWMPPIYRWWTLDRLVFLGPVFACLAIAALVRQFSLPITAMLTSANRLRAQAVIALARASVTLAVAFWSAGHTTLAGVATAVVAGELAGAALGMCLLWTACAPERCFPATASFLAGLHVVVAAVMLLVVPSSIVAWTAAFALHATVWFGQWRVLPHEVHKRFGQVCAAIYGRLAVTAAGSAGDVS